MKALIFSGLLYVMVMPLAAQTSQDILQKVDKLVAPLVTTNNFSGSIAVSRNGEILVSRSYGKMSREYGLDNGPDTRYYLASISMIFTSTAIMKLYEQGKVNLNDPLSKYIPDYPRGSEITISQMLAQRSGIPPIGNNGKVNYDSITKFRHTIEQLIGYFKQDKLMFDPGTKYNHSRSEYILLAYIIERISGKNYGQYLKDEILDPLGMKNTGHNYGEQEIVLNLAQGYAPKDLYDTELPYQIDWTSKTGHASIYSSANDLQKFAQAILEGRLLKKETWDKVFVNYGNDVGYSWFIRRHLNRDLFQMNGRAPGYSSYIGLYPKDNLVVVVLSNTYISLPPDIGKSIAAIAFNEKYETLNLTRKGVSPEHAKRLVGTYKFDEKFYQPNFAMEITYQDDHLYSTWGGLIPIDNGDKDFMTFILRPYWSGVNFQAGADGKITSMTLDNFKGVRIK